MRRKRNRSVDQTPAELYRAPIITQRLIIREATRADARELERTMDDANFGGGDRTSDGARRFGAGLSEVPVTIRQTTPQELLELAIIENVQRADLSPLEEAAAYQRLMNDFSLTQQQVAERVGRSRTAIANTVRLLDLPPIVSASLALDRITPCLPA